MTEVFNYYLCSECKSFDIEERRWVDVNTSEVGDLTDDNELYCNTCNTIGVSISKTMEYESITSQQALDLVGSIDRVGSYEPLGKFLNKDSNTKWVALDNSAGECFVEEFEAKQYALLWLAGDYRNGR